MAVMIACSPSTGSSLLRRLLNRHKKLFCGSETHLLCKEELYTDWPSAKYRLLKSGVTGLQDKAWTHFRGISLDEEYPISKSDLSQYLDKAHSFDEFLKLIFQYILQKTGKHVWLEKTPSNALCAPLFLDKISDSRLIHISRNPYDTVASLVNRGLSLYNAVAVYLLNTSHLLLLNENPASHLVKYEHLVKDPMSSLEGICDFLNVEMDESMLDTRNMQEGKDHMPGWQYRETQKIGQKSVNRFDDLASPEKEKICHALDCMVVKNENLLRIEEICDRLNYEYRPSQSNSSYVKALRYAKFRDGLKRFSKLSYFNIFNQAFDIKNG